MEHKIRCFAEIGKLLRRVVGIVPADIPDFQFRMGAILAVADSFERLRQILPHESARTCYQNVHQQEPPNSLSFSSNCFISSTHSRRVLWEVYAPILPSSGFPLLK